MRRSLIDFIKQNSDICYVSFFLFISLSTIAFGWYKIKTSPPLYTYVQIELGHGPWWQANINPTVWFTKPIQKGVVEKNILGQTVVEILSVRYYPDINDQLRVYIVLKLKINIRNNEYIYNRIPLYINSPVDLNIGSYQINGIIRDISLRLFNKIQRKKLLRLSKQNVTPWEYQTIHKDDEYHDGESTVFKVLDKYVQKDLSDGNKDIVVDVLIQTQEKGSNLYYGENQRLQEGDITSFATRTVRMVNFRIDNIRDFLQENK